MTPIAEEVLKREDEEEEHLSEKKEYWQNELRSLGIVEPDYLQNELITKRGHFKHWQKASTQSITKFTKKPIAVAVMVIIVVAH
jgi:hypothetical protein